MTELDFVADGWYKITGRGWVAAITNEPEQLHPKIDPNDLYHRYVKIDGKEYWIIGVERQGYSRRHFGLLVKGEK